MLLNFRRGLVPACLALSALLLAVPAMADTPAAQTITLQHTVPGDIIKSLHWDSAASLPAGVTQVQTLPTQNALAVTGTPAGVAKVREIVKLVDIEPRQVQVEFALSHQSTADLEASGLEFDLVPLASSDLPQGFVKYAAGPAVARFFQTLIKRGEAGQRPSITTSNNVKAAFSLTIQFPQGLSETTNLSVTPRVNSDNSVTLALHPQFTAKGVTREVSTFRTLKSGDTMLLVMPPAPPTDKGSLLWFVTATIIK